MNRLRRWLARLLESPRVSVPVDLQSEGCVYLNVHARPALRAALERNLIDADPRALAAATMEDEVRAPRHGSWDANGSPVDGHDELPIG